MKQLSLSYNGTTKVFDIVRNQVYNNGNENDLYVYLNNKTHAQALAFYPHAIFCAGVWVNKKDKDYKFVVRLSLPAEVQITCTDDEEKPQTGLTPMLKQFYNLKKKHPDALLLFRCGDFYETYCDDAVKASETLGITLTKSTKSKEKDGQSLRMAGFPYHALDTYLPKLVRAGHRIAICDQIETSAPNLKKRVPINSK